MDLSRDVLSLADFQQGTSEFMARLKATGQPVVLTVDGKAELVVQDAASYQKLLDIAARAEVVDGIRRGVEDWRAGRTEPVDVAFAAIRRELNLPDQP